MLQCSVFSTYSNLAGDLSAESSEFWFSSTGPTHHGRVKHPNIVLASYQSLEREKGSDYSAC